jgi:hypothetical protein
MKKTKIKRFLKRKLKLKTRVQRIVVAFLTLSFLFDVVWPTAAFALTGGPSQPEVQGFTPVDTSDMVDLSSGDFKYNIPLMDIDGYPVNIAYNSGITMDQEASWVGLGWNLNPGVVNRAVRSLPDDFAGDVITKEVNMKPNKTVSVNGGIDWELAGYPKGFSGGSGSFSLGLKYNNYQGISLEKSFNVSLRAGNFNAGLGITSSKEDGLSLQPNIGLNYKMENADKTSSSLGIKVGSSFNTRAGLKALSITANVSRGYENHVRRFSHRTQSSVSSGLGSAGASWDFGMPTYSPQIQNPMQTFSITGSFRAGGFASTVLTGYHVSASYSEQRLSTHTLENPAYGYLNSHKGDENPEALHDFNREKDGPFSKDYPTLPITNFTYDLFSVSGQGVGGSYRPFRSEIGSLYDNQMTNSSVGGSIGVELGFGYTTHAGIDVNVNVSNSTSGDWTSSNHARSKLNYRGAADYAEYEPFYFKEANEKSVESDPGFFSQYGNYDPERIDMDFSKNFNSLATSRLENANGANLPITQNNFRKKRDKRDQLFTFLTKSELNDYALELIPQVTANNAPDHHIGEVTSLGNDGRRYVYGLAAYNTDQQEITFATGSTSYDAYDNNSYDCAKGLVNYSSSDLSLNNSKGIDNYFSNTHTPKFAHSYMLTAVLSSDYVDSDNQRGPSQNDLGNYTHFQYKKISDYKWRTPFEANKASFNEGLNSIEYDNKGSVMYGTKDLYYLEKIETKNYEAYFYTSNRHDGIGVKNINGGFNSTSVKMLKLDSIALFVKGNSVPLKTVHFEYDYSLCPHVTNNDGAAAYDSYGNEINISKSKGKLTLKKVYFTYQRSHKARFSPYTFDYTTYNPWYNGKGYDRWGNFKVNPLHACGDLDSLHCGEFPYVEQDGIIADRNSAAWTLNKISLPSGGSINVTFESDDYAYVQDRKAMQMFMIEDMVSSASATPGAGFNVVDFDANISGLVTQDKFLVFKLSNPADPISKYIDGIDKMYFRFLMKILPATNGAPAKYEYVSGYGDIDHTASVTNNGYGYIRLKMVGLKDNDGNPNYSPIVKSGVQFARLNMPHEVYNQPSFGSEPGFNLNVLEGMLNFLSINQLLEMFEGPNKFLYGNKNVCRSAVMNKSWIRLNNANGHKLGGGSRVKKLEIADEWDVMTGNAETPFTYGQQYEYHLEDNSSSGVASYEPQLGGDENPFKQPEFYSEEKLMAPDDEHYVEGPFGESFFPSPTITYGRVTVKNLSRTNVTKHATGFVVHEFYTTKDYPTITQRTTIDAQRDKTKFSISALLSVRQKDHLTASQGFVIELNDMNGKPKGQKVYAEKAKLSEPRSEVIYKYKHTAWGNNANRLDNNCTVIFPDGTVKTDQRLGVFFDGVLDNREKYDLNESYGAQANFEVVAPIGFFFFWPSVGSDETQFRSTVFTKVIQRFGILEETTAKEDGSTVTTRNLAYDSETGEVLLTETINDFDDPVYSFSYPAYWYYDQMGPAYKNIGFEKSGVTFTNGVAQINGANNYFSEGDELALNGNSNERVWVTSVSQNSLQVVRKLGPPPNSGTYDIKVLRSGRRNMQGTPMASLTSMANPLNYIKNNSYEKVLQAGATEFSNYWKTHCDCFGQGKDNLLASTNPYILGTRGNWKPKISWLSLSPRTQSNYNDNTNIRKDGLFTSYTPFYKYSNGAWIVDSKNWTYTSEVTEFSPYGQELENRDALGRYSAATFGFNQNMATAVAANSQYKQIGFDSFEDYAFADCADNHFKFTKNSVLSNLSVSEYHTGRNSVKVSAGQPLTMKKVLENCNKTQCDIALSFVGSSDQFTATITGGIAPYTIEFTDVQGSASTTMTGSNVIKFSNVQWVNGQIVITVEVVDSKGCRLVKQITAVNKIIKGGEDNQTEVNSNARSTSNQGNENSIQFIIN